MDDGFQWDMEHITIYRFYTPDKTLIWEYQGYMNDWIRAAIITVLNHYEEPEEYKKLLNQIRETHHAHTQLVTRILQDANRLRQWEHYALLPDRIKAAIEAIG